MAGISLGFAGKASQEGLQEEEVEHGAFRTALPQASVDTNARRGATWSDNAHRGAAAEGMEVLDELLRNPHVAQEKCQCPMQGRVESLGDIEGQDMILLLFSLQPSVRWARNTGAAAVEPSMAPNCQCAANPLLRPSKLPTPLPTGWAPRAILYPPPPVPPKTRYEFCT